MSAHAPNHADHATPHGSMRDYLIGFGLSVVLTAIPFWLVMAGVIANPTVAALTIVGFAIVQMLVHMVYFLHLNGRVEGGWTMMATIFTIVLVAIAITGSVWVMYHLNLNMMPGMAAMGDVVS